MAQRNAIVNRIIMNIHWMSQYAIKGNSDTQNEIKCVNNPMIRQLELANYVISRAIIFKELCL